MLSYDSDYDSDSDSDASENQICVGLKLSTCDVFLDI